MDRILFVAHRIPYPPNKGDKIRTFNELKFLSGRFPVDLLCLADDPSDLEYEETLREYCENVKVFPLKGIPAKIRGGLALLTGKALSSRFFYLDDLQDIFDRWLNTFRYGAVFCFSSSVAEYVFRSRSLQKLHPDDTPKIVMDFCDVDSDKWRQYAETSSYPASLIYRQEHKRLKTYEMKIQRCFDHTILVSEQEAELFRTYGHDSSNLVVISNGVDHEYFSPAFAGHTVVQVPSGPVIVFTGAMDYSVNVAGVVWFSRNVLPGLRRKYPSLKFYIVGNNPVPDVMKLADDSGNIVTGFVEDIRDYYALADICVAPLHMGRGVQNKVLEAMAMGRPVVSTSRANAGVGGDAGVHLLIADSAQQFLDAIFNLLEDTKQAASIGRAARDFVVRHFDWDTNMLKLQELLLENSKDSALSDSVYD